jgi:hypothetical protein
MLRTSVQCSLLFLMIACLGCGGGGKVATVTGKVTLGGKPLPNATVSFSPKEGGRPSTGVTDEDGDYELRYTAKEDGAEIGEHVVRVSTFEESDGTITSPERVPAQYNVSTTLVKKVEPGSNEINLDLEAGGRIVSPDEDLGAIDPFAGGCN